MSELSRPFASPDQFHGLWSVKVPADCRVYDIAPCRKSSENIAAFSVGMAFPQHLKDRFFSKIANQ
jgi:hypothetical protein